MKIQEYFRTPRGYKRLAIWAAVVLLTIPVLRPLTFLVHYLTERMSIVYKLSICVPVVFIVVMLTMVVVMRIKRKPIKWFRWLCAGTAVVIYFVYTFVFSIVIYPKPSRLGAIRMLGKNALYNPVGIKKVQWDKPYLYIAEYYNTHRRERCYVGIYSNSYAWVDVVGLIEIDIFDSKWQAIDHCAVQVVRQEEADVELGELLNDIIGIETKKIFSQCRHNSWSEFRDYYCSGYYCPNAGYEFVTSDGTIIYPFDTDHNDGIYYGWSDNDFYDADGDQLGKSFKHLKVHVLNRPAFAGQIR